MKKNVIFAGTPDFAAIQLQALIDAGTNVVAVYTQPDRPAGRGKKLQASAVKKIAIEYDIPVEQPLNFKDQSSLDRLKNYQSDLMVVVAYGIILPQAVLDTPRLGCINVHASLLPRWRGAAPIQRAIEAGDQSTGICIMQMEAGLDTGPVLAKVETAINAETTFGSLHDDLARISQPLLLSTMDNIESLDATIQGDDGVTYAHKIDRAQTEIKWNQSAVDIQRMIRAFNPFPGTFSQWDDIKVKIFASEIIDNSSDFPAGTVTYVDKKQLHVQCGTQQLSIKELQIPGGKRLTIQQVLSSPKISFEQGKMFTYE